MNLSFNGLRYTINKLFLEIQNIFLSLPRNFKADNMITFPNSKINIGLNVVNKRPDGYHDIETVFYPVNLQDALEINLMKPLETSSIRKAVERTIGKSVEGDRKSVV